MATNPTTNPYPGDKKQMKQIKEEELREVIDALDNALRVDPAYRTPIIASILKLQTMLDANKPKTYTFEEACKAMKSEPGREWTVKDTSMRYKWTEDKGFRLAFENQGKPHSCYKNSTDWMPVDGKPYTEPVEPVDEWETCDPKDATMVRIGGKEFGLGSVDGCVDSSNPNIKVSNDCGVEVSIRHGVWLYLGATFHRRQKLDPVTITKEFDSSFQASNWFRDSHIEDGINHGLPFTVTITQEVGNV
jgi:hypothetical protein